MGMLCAILSGAQEYEQKAPAERIPLTTDTLYWEIPQLNLGRIMKFSDLDSINVFNNDVEKGQSYSFVLSTEGWKREFKSSNSSKLIFPLELSKNGATKQLKLIFWPDISHAEFNEPYRKANSGQLSFETPESYELCYVALSLAMAGKNTNYYPLNVNSDYYKEIISYFTAFSTHPLIQALQSAIRANGNTAFYSLCMDSYSYSFDAKGQLEKLPRYKNLGNRVRIEEDLALWQDFVKVSGFRKFYEEHAGFYKSMADEAKASLAFNDAWAWTEKNFSYRVNDYRFVLSPLSNSFYRRNELTHNGYAETLLFSHSFDKSSYKNINESSARFLYLSNYFVAGCRNYIQHMKDIDKQAILALFSDYDTWAEVGKEAFNYPDGSALFAEYLAQACFLLYVKQVDKDSYRTVKYLRDRFMKQRGFKQFEKFYNSLEKIYEANERKKLEALINVLLDELKK